MSVAPPKKIGRFEIQRVLGSGVQGSVYLAKDPRLGRLVAIKALAVAGEGAEHRQRIEALLSDGRIVAQLSHPNIVPLFDAGEDARGPYFVFEYVQGQVLADVLRPGVALPVKRAIDITIQILRAVGFAHQKGLVHRDLRPGNIILTGDDVARVMDFGIAKMMPTEAPQDLVSVAMTLYQMLTGRAVDLAGDVVAPSRINQEIDEQLDELVMKALGRKPRDRFETAAQLENALYLYLNPEPEYAAPADATTGTLGFLLRRMRHKSDFPALSATIAAINKATVSESGGASVLSESILKDFALTNKLLKMVNTAHFGHFGGTISTISKAVVIIGFDGIRGAAMTLMLFEHLQNKAQAARLKDELLASYFSGILARQLAPKAGVHNSEEAFICATFHNLGRLLTAFYFPEEAREIENMIRQQDASEMQASLKVLGVSFEDLGIGVAKVWNFPPTIVQSMRHIREARIKRPVTEDQKLRALASLAAGVCDALRENTDEARDAKLRMLVATFGEALGISAEFLKSCIQESRAEFARDAIVLNLKPEDSAFSSSAAKSDKTEAGSLQNALSETTLDAGYEQKDLPEDPKRKAMLFDGIQHVTNAMMGDFELNDILRKILATMYSSMGFTRVLLYVRDAGSNSLKSRYGLGLDVESVVGGKFSISLDESKDVFQACVAKGLDVFVDNVNAEQIRKHIPDAYRKAIPARSFALFPIVVKGKPIGLFYGDSDVEGSIRFTAEELMMLKTLRNQAVLAIKQSA